jgi:hypothetical protein
MCSIFCLFHQHLCEHLSFCGHVVLVEEPLAVTNIKVVKLKPWLAGTCRVIEQHSLRYNKTEIQINKSDLKKQIKFWFLLKMISD